MPVVGVEISEQAVEDAKFNATLNGKLLVHRIVYRVKSFFLCSIRCKKKASCASVRRLETFCKRYLKNGNSLQFKHESCFTSAQNLFCSKTLFFLYTFVYLCFVFIPHSQSKKYIAKKMGSLIFLVFLLVVCRWLKMRSSFVDLLKKSFT